MNNIKHIVAYSGGHSSALVAIEVCRKFGAENVILLNHNISAKVEPADVKRFKQEIADYLGVAITYANHPEWEEMTPIDVCAEAGTWVNPSNRQILCTNRLKTAPFYDWLKINYREGDIVYYGFDASEKSRITRRSSLMGQSGYKTDYPLALWGVRTINATTEICIQPPLSYGLFKHANCVGCLKAGKQHWYIVYSKYPEIWQAGKLAEESIGHSVHSEGYFEDWEEMFAAMKAAGIAPTEKTPSGEFWAKAKRELARIENEKTQFSLFDIPVFEKSVECTGDCRL